MRIVFRVDSSTEIGSGHVMRCLTLAHELRKRGADVMFVCREHPGHLIGMIEGKAFPVVSLQLPEAEYVVALEDVAHAGWLGVSWRQDAADTVAAMGEARPQWLIVDHYALDSRWEGALRSYAGKIMVIDDLADRPHDCDLLLDQNLYKAMESRYDNLLPSDCKKILGPKYAMLRREFVESRMLLRRRYGVVRTVLVFFGGSDNTCETEKTLHAIAAIPDRTFDVDVVVGWGNPRKESIATFCSAHFGFRLHCQVEKMAELLARADLAVGAGGTTTWERCALGLPSLVISVADNQKPVASWGGEQGLFFFLGDAAIVTEQKIREAISLFSSSQENLRSFSVKALQTVDARGTQRVVSYLVPLSIKLRRASMADCEALLEWRNAEETRRYSFDPAPISQEAHCSWLYSTLSNPDQVILIGELEDKPMGVLRFEFSRDRALISVYLVPGGQGQGGGTQLIQAGSLWVSEHRPKVAVIDAKILEQNIASLRAFEQAGYRKHHVTFEKVLK